MFSTTKLTSAFLLRLKALPELYNMVRNRVLAELEQAAHVALTTDLWTSRAHKSYITVTAHFITKEFQMIARVLNTVEVPESHTAINLASRLRQIVDDWQITGKISCIVTDNASNIIKAVLEHLDWRHIPCFAHTLNLVYKDSISEVAQLEVLITK